MKTKRNPIQIWLLCAALSTFTAFYMAQPSTVFAQGTAFTYQGRLQNNGSPASGTYNLAFSLFNTNTSGVPIAGPVTNNAVSVTNGLFTMLIDFGPGAFTGATNWLEIAVETNGVNTFTTLTPRQQLTPTPYAIYAESASGLSGTLSASQLTSIGNTNGGLFNFFVGPSGNSTMSGNYNTANGDDALALNASGSFNTANGFQALYSNTSGDQNTANGFNALFLNTSGYGNTAIGLQALVYNTSGSYNIALGYLAGYNITTGDNNIDIGNVGFSTDTNIIRIGSSQSQTFIAGVITGNGGGLTNLNASQLTGTVPGVVQWQTASGTMQAQPNNGYLATDATQVTVTLPTSPNVGDIIRVSGPAAGGWKIAQNAGQAIQTVQFTASVLTTNWNTLTNWTQTGAPNEFWGAIASSSDGTKLVAGVADGEAGGIYTSTDSGVTWSQTSAPGDSWGWIASSADGTKLAAASANGGIWTSTNSGITWMQTSAPGGWWSSIASSADGTKLAATMQGYNSGGIYTSTNFGLTWIQSSVPAVSWNGVASSANGNKLVAVWSQGVSSGIYTSTNFGVTWTQTSAPGEEWQSIASSADGSKLAATVYGGGIYTSTDSGATWIQTSAPGENWHSIASSADGTKLAASIGSNSTGIYASTNSGASWTQISPYWQGSIACSSDGTKLVLAPHLGGIWTAQATIQQTTTTPGTAGYLAGGQNSAIELQYIGNGQFMPLSYVGTISAY